MSANYGFRRALSGLENPVGNCRARLCQHIELCKQEKGGERECRFGVDPREADRAAPAHDPVNHPSHYTQGKIEVIDFLEDQQLGFHEANAVKYVARARHKGNELQDLRKAAWYLNRRIEQLSTPTGGAHGDDR